MNHAPVIVAPPGQAARRRLERAGPHPVILAAVGTPASPAAALGGPLDADVPVGEILPFQRPERPSRTRRRR